MREQHICYIAIDKEYNSHMRYSTQEMLDIIHRDLNIDIVKIIAVTRMIYSNSSDVFISSCSTESFLDKYIV